MKMFDLSIKLLLQAVALLQYKSNLKFQLAFHITAEDSSSYKESGDDEEIPGLSSKEVKLESMNPCLIVRQSFYSKILDCIVMYIV